MNEAFGFKKFQNYLKFLVLVFKQSFKYLKNEKINFIKEIL